MAKINIGKIFAVSFAMGIGISCETTDVAAPAVLGSADENTMNVVRDVLSDATGRSRIALGAGDPTVSPLLSVLPPRPVDREGRSLAKPEIFEIFMRGTRCFLRHRSTGEEYLLRGVDCRVI